MRLSGLSQPRQRLYDLRWEVVAFHAAFLDPPLLLTTASLFV